MKILFVCTGNTCRSPMAEYLARALDNKNEYTSAGMFVQSGSTVSKNAVEVMNELGIDISAHRPTQITREMTEQADRIYTMSAFHRSSLISLGVPEQKLRLFSREIPDPFGGDVAVYRQCRDTLQAELRQEQERFNED